MDISTIIILGLIVAAFVVFAAALMYGDYATQQPRRARANQPVQAELQPTPPSIQHRDAA